MDFLKILAMFIYSPWMDMIMMMWAGAAMALAFVLGGKEKA